MRRQDRIVQGALGVLLCFVLLLVFGLRSGTAITLALLGGALVALLDIRVTQILRWDLLDVIDNASLFF
ncbi:MAG: hypothetical protein U0166_02045 [Acidobacteriota bacterium]